MAEVLLSTAEKTYILHGVDEDFRTDGRNRRTYRPIELETEVVIHANGSARLRLANTDILVGVKTEIDTPFPERPNEGKIEFFVDCSANATPAFEGRGGEDLATEISASLARAYMSSQVFNLSPLIITPGVHCWKLYVDILILECGGNLFDAVSLAVKAALHNTRVPKVENEGKDGDEEMLVLSQNYNDCTHLDVSNTPVLITLCKIGDNCVVDPTAEEEACSVASVVIAVTESGLVTSVFKTGEGSLSPHTFRDALIEGRDIGYNLNKTLKNALLREAEKVNEGGVYEPYGFLK
ncbi:exosome complex component RRP42 [Schistocerca gregaria]|uniref:exosome complex component RRP42 n=1 Tax=Schistocerca gregaria TaxID=7010 RepID=UPI00211EA927|nr:exosome complex component RRP42 [Schistocerca gregaria]